MTSYRFPKAILDQIRLALPEETSLFGDRPRFPTTYLPAGHAKALHPDNMLVVGMRGVGKSHWYQALQDGAQRTLIGKNYSRSGLSEQTIVSVGFGETISPHDYPGKDSLAKLTDALETRHIWRTIVLTHLARCHQPESPLGQLETWTQRIDWIQEHPEEMEQLVCGTDTMLEQKGVHHLILFDALDRSADDWQSMRKLVKGLLQTLLEFRTCRRIRLKAFLRPDHLEDPSVTAFPDASKVSLNAVNLSWRNHELFGLLWQYLANAEENHLFIQGCQEGFGIGWSSQHGRREVPEALRNDEQMQRKVFHALTGPFMGEHPRRGFPYTWVPNHLEDTAQQVFPRSFLAALRYAADNDGVDEYPYALHYENIKKGVRNASRIRIQEMQEDYPWIEPLMRPLAGFAVPCPFETLAARWEREDVLNSLQQEMDATREKAPPPHIGEGTSGVRKDLENLGLFGRLSDDRVNMPDIYRIGYGLGRQGGRINYDALLTELFG
ncbi:MAG: hypothetical protein HQL56_07815 [Magnetococcales bacterium]|nr:hypothetical protein [Magnetococcales bacterium]